MGQTNCTYNHIVSGTLMHEFNPQPSLCNTEDVNQLLGVCIYLYVFNDYYLL